MNYSLAPVKKMHLTIFIFVIRVTSMAVILILHCYIVYPTTLLLLLLLPILLFKFNITDKSLDKQFKQVFNALTVMCVIYGLI